jgi:hypothetical protein
VSSRAQSRRVVRREWRCALFASRCFVPGRDLLLNFRVSHSSRCARIPKGADSLARSAFARLFRALQLACHPEPRCLRPAFSPIDLPRPPALVSSRAQSLHVVRREWRCALFASRCFVPGRDLLLGIVSSNAAPFSILRHPACRDADSPRDFRPSPPSATKIRSLDGPPYVKLSSQFERRSPP